MKFVNAKHEPSLARVALAGPPGTDCDEFAMEIATQITSDGSVAVIDSGRTFSSLADSYDFDLLNIADNPKSSSVRLAADQAETAGYDCLIVTGLTQAWLQLRGEIDRQKIEDGTEPSAAWFEGRRAYRNMITALQAWPGHVIVVAETKVEFAVDTSGPQPFGRPISLEPLDDGNLFRDWSVIGRVDFDHAVTFDVSVFAALAGKRFGINDLDEVLPGFVEWLGDVDSEGKS